MNYKQKLIGIGQVLLPIIYYDNKEYYPLSYVFENILLKGRQNTKLLKERGYEEELKQFKINFNFKNGGTNNTNCISKEGLIDLLSKSNIGGLTVEQKQGMNSILEYFDLDLIDEDPRFLDNVSYKDDNGYDEFEKDCIEETLKLEGHLVWQRCKDCGKYYPLHSNFFAYNTIHKIFKTVCNNCSLHNGKIGIVYPDSTLNHIFKTYGHSVYLSYKAHDTIEIYLHYLKNKSEYPKIIENKNDYLAIIYYLYKNDKIDKNSITISYLVNRHRLTNITKHLKINEVYACLFENHPWEYPWQYKKYKVPNYSTEQSKIVFNNYLNENNIIINDIYTFNYGSVLAKSRLRQFDKDLLQFVMNYHDNQYPAYKFKVASVNYWKSKENRDTALKYLIEEDMKLEIEKIPLYLTITSIRNIGATTMYNVLKNYYSNLYEWVNEIYPDRFNPKDFDINYMRNEFDSIDEQTIDDILKSDFDNVLYNPKHNKHTIKLLGKIPDWFIFTTTGVIIVEYFGLWAKKRGMYNSRTRDYIISSKDKIEKYKTLQGYKFLYIYPEDLDNNFEGLHNKINDMKNGKKLNIV